MLINTSEFKNVLKKSTLDYCINSVQLNFTKEKLTSSMISSSSDAIAILNLPNLVLPEMKKTDTLVMNFSEPNANILPYLNLIDDNEETKINIKDEKITLVQGKQKSNMFFCSELVVGVYEGEGPKSDIEYFNIMDIDDDFMNSFSKIKKIGAKFNKIYFGVSNNVLYIETSDKQNRFSNGLRIDLCDVEYDDMSMCFNFKNVVNVMSILENEFKCHFTYVPSQELGMVYIGNEDESEKYYLMSKIDN